MSVSWISLLVVAGVVFVLVYRDGSLFVMVNALKSFSLKLPMP